MTRLSAAEREERSRHGQACLVCGAHTGEPSKNKPPRKFCSGKCMGAARRGATCFMGHPLGPNRKARCSECARNRNRRKRKGLVYACQFCSSTENMGLRAKTCSTCKRRAYPRQRMLRRYGIDVATLDGLVIRSEGRCEGCSEKTSDLNIDHCHKSGRVRGLLCSGCNTAAGIIEDERGQRVAQYLARHGEGLPLQGPRPRERAAEVIRANLTVTPVPATDILRIVKAKSGVEVNTAKRAAKLVGVVVSRQGRRVFWSKPRSYRPQAEVSGGNSGIRE